MDSYLVTKFGGFIPEITYTIPFVGEVYLTSYILAILLFVGLLIIFKVVLVGIIAHLKKLSKKTNTNIDDVLISAIAGIRLWVYTIIAIYLSLQVFNLPPFIEKIIAGVFLVAVVWQLIEIAIKFVDYFAVSVLEKDEDGDGESDPNTVVASHMLSLFARIIFWVLGFLFILSNLGIEVLSLVAGLGIGGVAIAFALQGILSDLFSSLSLYLDKPFRIGDFIHIGNDSGIVEKIGIKTTRIRTLQGEELVISNTELTTTRVQNFKKMKERRSSLSFGVTYETPYEKIKKIPDIVKAIFETIPNARLDRIHFTALGDSALIFDVVYFVDSPKYVVTLDAQHTFNMSLMEAMAENGIEFAYPTQTLYLKK